MNNTPKYGFNFFPIPPNNCAVSYNFFNQTTEIEEGETRLEISYGDNGAVAINSASWVKKRINQKKELTVFLDIVVCESMHGGIIE